jgi:uncharacterized protein
MIFDPGNKDFACVPENIRCRIVGSKSIAIWPLDENPLSESYQAARYFQDHGWKIYPINDLCERILDQLCYRDIRLIPDDYDILFLFVQPDQLPETVNAVFNADYIPPVICTHTGVEDQCSFDRLMDAGITTLMDIDLKEACRMWADE